MIECWRDIPGYEQIYQVSSLGRIRRIGRAAKSGKGHGGGARIGRIRKLQENRFGYQTIDLWANGKQKTIFVHRLVAAAFIGQRPDNHFVNHKDGDKKNNKPANLEYVTSSENNKHAYDIGLKKASVSFGGQHHNATLSTDQILEIRRRYVKKKYGSPRLAKEFGVTHKTILQIVNNRSRVKG